MLSASDSTSTAVLKTLYIHHLVTTQGTNGDHKSDVLHEKYTRQISNKWRRQHPTRVTKFNMTFDTYCTYCINCAACNAFKNTGTWSYMEVPSDDTGAMKWQMSTMHRSITTIVPFTRHLWKTRRRDSHTGDIREYLNMLHAIPTLCFLHEVDGPVSSMIAPSHEARTLYTSSQSSVFRSCPHYRKLW